MANVFSEHIAVSIDVGTTKICVIVARVRNGGPIEVLGIGKVPSHGLKKGIVIDIDQTVASIRAAVHEAELVSGHTIEAATIGVSGSHVRSLNSQGAIPIRRGIVREQDINEVLAAAQAIAIPEGQRVLHVLPQYFRIDGQEPVLRPLGMAGIRLEAQVHIITGSTTSVQNLVSCCQMAGVKVTDIVLEQLASAYAVLSPDERELGIGIVDIGGGTSDFAIYQNSSIRYTMVLPVAGNQFTNDLAVGLHTNLSEAERIKITHGLVKTRAGADRLISISCVHDNQPQMISEAQLMYILHARAYEVFNLLKRDIERHNLRPLLTTGLVLTGGGALLSGMQHVASKVLSIPVRIGAPKTGHVLPESLDSPIYSTGYGLLLHAFNGQTNNNTIGEDTSNIGRVLERMKTWISDFF